MSIADMNIDDIPELKALPAGEEVRVRIGGKPEIGTKDDGSQYVRVRLVPYQHTDVKEISHFLGLPDEQFDDRKNAGRGRRIKQFCDAFKIDTGAGSLVAILDGIEGWEGLEAWAILGLDEDERYGEQNYATRLRPV